MQLVTRRVELPRLWHAVSACGPLANRWLSSQEALVCLDTIASSSYLSTAPNALRGRSILLRTETQLASALALFELDGVAKRIVLCPPGVQDDHIPGIISAASIDCIVCAGKFVYNCDTRIERVAICNRPSLGTRTVGDGNVETEWVLLTSGTTGPPKLVMHTLLSLSGAIAGHNELGAEAVWSTFYDIRRYGGLQIFLRAMLGGGSIVLSSAGEAFETFFRRATSRGVTHISGTPSHWRVVLMCAERGSFAPRYVRLSGEIVDQSVLDHLRQAFPGANIAHAFASTEAGVAFDVRDGLAGFPESIVTEGSHGAVEIRVEDGLLRIKSDRIAACYLGEPAKPLRDADGFVDTQDAVQLRNGRYYFAGRRDGVINIGGQKVHPEEVEAVINRHPAVRMCRVWGRRNPIVGALVMADVLADQAMASETAKAEILSMCRKELPRHKVPATIRFVPSLELAPSGKLGR